MLLSKYIKTPVTINNKGVYVEYSNSFVYVTMKFKIKNENTYLRKINNIKIVKNDKGQHLLHNIRVLDKELYSIGDSDNFNTITLSENIVKSTNFNKSHILNVVNDILNKDYIYLILKYDIDSNGNIKVSKKTTTHIKITYENLNTGNNPSMFIENIMLHAISEHKVCNRMVNRGFLDILYLDNNFNNNIKTCSCAKNPEVTFRIPSNMNCEDYLYDIAKGCLPKTNSSEENPYPHNITVYNEQGLCTISINNPKIENSRDSIFKVPLLPHDNIQFLTVNADENSIIPAYTIIGGETEENPLFTKKETPNMRQINISLPKRDTNLFVRVESKNRSPFVKIIPRDDSNENINTVIYVNGVYYGREFSDFVLFNQTLNIRFESTEYNNVNRIEITDEYDSTFRVLVDNYINIPITKDRHKFVYRIYM